MPKKFFPPGAALYPAPVILVSCIDKNGANDFSSNFYPNVIKWMHSERREKKISKDR